jgi:hypothetical protein
VGVVSADVATRSSCLSASSDGLASSVSVGAGDGSGAAVIEGLSLLTIGPVSKFFKW